MRRKITFLVAVLTLSLLANLNAQAQSQERIRMFESDINLNASALAVIHETIRYDFGGNQRRGIYRDIPLQYVIEGDQGYQLTANVLNVKRGGQPEEYKVFKDNPEYLRIRIGNPDVTISGEHVYEIYYEIQPVVIRTDDGQDIVRLDIPGSGWSVPTEQASATLNTPFTTTSSTCYVGSPGSTEQCRVTKNGNLRFTSDGMLSAGHTLTLEAAYAGGTFKQTAQLTTLQTGPQQSFWQGFLFGLGGILVFLFAVVRPIISYILYRLRRRKELVIARYEPPKNMSPAELGLLLDNSSSSAELTAALLDMAVNGYLKIVQTKEKKWWRRAEYDFIKKKPADGAMPKHQKDLYLAIFRQGKRVSAKELAESTRFQKANRKFHKRLRDNLMGMGFYKPVNILRLNLNSRMSESGYTKWAHVEGFREFLQMTQAERLLFHNAPEKKPQEFSQYLPHAVALGVEKQWAEQFRNLELDTSDWYQSAHGQSVFHGHELGGFASSLGKGIGSIAASANRSSGTSGAGGGFSGGGFSGGGGSSW